jgi:transposase
MTADTQPIALATIANANLLHPKDFVRLYREHLSGFNSWTEREHADKWLVFPENIGCHLAIDEVDLSDGDFYTVVTNKVRHGKKGCLVGICEGTQPDEVCTALCRIPQKLRENVETITRDMAETMTQISTKCFPFAMQVDDRFHVQKLVSEALQEVRIELRKDAIKAHNQEILAARQRGGHYWAPRFENGDTPKELLSRSRHLLYKTTKKWSPHQKVRAEILFREHPKLKEAYDLTMHFRGIYEHAKTRNDGLTRLRKWYLSVEKRVAELPSFATPRQTIELNEKTIVNYFFQNGHQTNAAAESFNSKIKGFRALQRGVKDTSFFLYRLAMLYG